MVFSLLPMYQILAKQPICSAVVCTKRIHTTLCTGAYNAKDHVSGELLARYLGDAVTRYPRKRTDQALR